MEEERFTIIIQMKIYVIFLLGGIIERVSTLLYSILKLAVSAMQLFMAVT